MPRLATRNRAWGCIALLVGALSLWVANVSKPGSQVRGCLRGCASSSRGVGDRLRVLSLNVLHGFPGGAHRIQRLDLLAEAARQQNVDILCLQEVPWSWRHGSGAGYLARRLGMNHLYLRANGSRWAIGFEEGVAILSRYPLRNPAFVELMPRAGPFEHRVALRATAETPWGDVDLVVTHLTHGPSGINRQQAGSLMAWVGRATTHPTLIAGDMNAVEDSPQMRMLARSWVDVYRAAKPDAAGPTCCVKDLTRRFEPLEVRIDYLFLMPGLGRDLRVLGAERMPAGPIAASQGWQWISDHVGIVADVTLDRGTR